MNRVERVHQTTHDEVAEGRIKKTSTAKTQKAYNNLVLGVCRCCCCCCFGMILTRLYTHKQTHLEFDIPTDTTKMHIQHSLPKLT